MLSTPIWTIVIGSMKNEIEFASVESSPLVGVPVHESRSDSVGVMRAAGTYRVVAIRSISSGERLFPIEGERTDRPSRYSVQIGKNLHIDLAIGLRAEEILDRHPWRFINHSCDPSALVHNLEVVACREIQPWEEVTLNYNTTEYVIAERFTCRCGSVRCLGEIRGFKHLPPAERERLRFFLAPHLRRILLQQPQFQIGAVPA